MAFRCLRSQRPRLPSWPGFDPAIIVRTTKSLGTTKSRSLRRYPYRDRLMAGSKPGHDDHKYMHNILGYLFEMTP